MRWIANRLLSFGSAAIHGQIARLLLALAAIHDCHNNGRNDDNQQYHAQYDGRNLAGPQINVIHVDRYGFLVAGCIVAGDGHAWRTARGRVRGFDLLPGAGRVFVSDEQAFWAGLQSHNAAFCVERCNLQRPNGRCASSSIGATIAPATKVPVDQWRRTVLRDGIRMKRIPVNAVNDKDKGR